MGELPLPHGNMVSVTDLALALWRRVCLTACFAVIHSLSPTCLDVPYRWATAGGNRVHAVSEMCIKIVGGVKTGLGSGVSWDG